MRLDKVWTIAAKDLKIFKTKKSILYSLIGFQIFISAGLPFMVNFLGENLGLSAAVLTVLINGFSFFFVLEAAIVPTSIAAYSVVGERVERSLEPLLAAPVTDEEILLGKSLASLIPSILAIYIGAALYMLLINLVTADQLGYLYYPNALMLLMLGLLSPLACVLDIELNVIISAKCSDVRTAQQLGMLMIFPFGAIYALSGVNFVKLTIHNLLRFSIILLIADIIFFYVAKATFRREEILTKWK